MAGAQCPLPIDRLDPVLERERPIRGTVFSGDLGTILNQIALDYQDLVWWLSNDGLVMEIIEPPPQTGGLSVFNRIAGEIMTALPPGEKLSSADFHSLIAKLDAAGEKLKENLQPAQWKEIAAHNQKYSRAPIRTFADASKEPQFARYIRRRLYPARDAYAAALQLPRRHLEKYDAQLDRKTSKLFCVRL